MKATELTNHGAALVGVPLDRRWNDAPVKLRCDIEAHAKRVRGYWMEEPLDKLAEIMDRLSLGSADFGGLGDKSLDAFVKAKVALHHRTWLMRPLEGLYDELKKATEPAEAGTTNGVEALSVAELCDEIREAPYYDQAEITPQQLRAAYERLHAVSRELVEWLDGSGDARDAMERVGKGGLGV